MLHSKRKGAAGAFLYTAALLVALVGVMSTVCTSPVKAQSVSTGTIEGQVVDPQNAAVVGAAVTLADKSTGATRTAETNDVGRYIFPQVPPGEYNVTVAKEGFSQAKIADQGVSIGVTLTINVSLKVGATTQTIEVNYTPGAALQTTNATTGTTIDTKSLDLLPNIARDASALATLQPGVTPTGQTAGLQSDQNTYQLDGGNVSDDMAGGNNTYTPSLSLMNPVGTGGSSTGAIPTPVESVEEVKVNVSNQTADFNGSGGSQVQMTTRRGGNDFHGSLYDYYLDSHVGQANTWDNLKLGPGPCTPFGKDANGNKTCISVPSTHRNRFGAAVGGPVGKKSFLGGRTYFFANYEGLRYPFLTTLDKVVPSATLRAGVIGVQDPQGISYFNVNPFPVTVNGTTYQPTTLCSGVAAGCDPRGIGINSFVKTIWNTMEPLPNDPSAGDQINSQGYISTVSLPVTSNFGVARIDHDFGQKWHWMASYRYYHMQYESTNQIDIGGVLPGDTFGQANSKITRPVIPSFYVTGLTTNISSNVTNDFHANFTRNFWLWNSSLVPSQFGALPAPLEIGGETSSSLIPYNVDAQDVRERFWNGRDTQIRDDISWIKGNHVFQFGGLYERNNDIHQRDDNGVQTLAGLVYISGGSQASNIALPASFAPPTCPSSTVGLNCLTSGFAGAGGTYNQLYQEILGMVSLPQTIVTRSGPNFALNNPSTAPATSQVIIPSYNIYFNDTWHMKPSFTVSYGLGYTIEMPPYDVSGVQTSFVYADGSLVSADNWLQQRKQAALAGQIFLPQIGYELVKNTGRKYAYNPFYGGVSPHISAAWNPNFDEGILGHVFGHGKTVIRGGWTRIFGRLNGVDLVLVPMLGAGPLQVITCSGASAGAATDAFAAAGSAPSCLGAGNVSPTTAFRIGTDGNTAPLPAISPTLPQPNSPGFNTAASLSADTSQLDPNFRVNRSDEFTLDIQRELPGKMLLEVGAISRKIGNEYQAIELSSVPYMMTLGNQEFVGAYDYLYSQLQTATYGGAGLSVTNNGANGSMNCGTGSATCTITAQPFFESAFKMPSGSAGSTVINGNTVSNYCAGFVSCTAAVASKQASNIKNVGIYTMWTGMPMTFGQSTCPTCTANQVPGAVPTVYGQSQISSISMETSDGWGNYNAAFVSLTSNNYHGVTARSNFTWARAFGTGDYTQSTSSTSVADPFDLQRAYGPQSYDFRFLYNLSMLYQPQIFKSQHGVIGRLLGGWAIAPIFTANSGAPLRVFELTGSSSCPATAWGAVPCNLGAFENATIAAPFTGGNSAHMGVLGSSGIGTTTTTGINIFSNPAAVYAGFAPTVPGINQSSGGAGIVRGFPVWNLDATISKDLLITERVGATFVFSFTNVLNHVQYSNPTLNLASPGSFGVVSSSTAGNPTGPFVRQLEMGLRLHF
ncbi:MAG TPA: carboxypeptidase-like regulatory domain-containing protein [Candidatus Acidoferrales bacterium]|nr:carboxypeptidase-like regulatory domain-containing protein [Candidatus Acidoferrales bacterium]